MVALGNDELSQCSVRVHILLGHGGWDGRGGVNIRVAVRAERVLFPPSAELPKQTHELLAQVPFRKHMNITLYVSKYPHSRMHLGLI